MNRRSLLYAFFLASCAGAQSRVGGTGAGQTGIVKVQVLRQTDQGPSAVTNGATLHSGDRLRLIVEVPLPAFLYVVQQNANNALVMLLPAPGAAPVSIQPGSPTRLPTEAQWFVLDEEVGEETLYLIATTRPLDSANVIQLLTSGDFTRDRDPPPLVPDKKRGITRSATSDSTPLNENLSKDGIAVVRFRYLHE